MYRFNMLSELMDMHLDLILSGHFSRDHCDFMLVALFSEYIRDFSMGDKM